MGRNVGSLLEGKSYKFSGAVVRTYRGSKYLSLPRDSFDSEVIDDIGDVHLDEVTVVGVKYFDSYSACYSCNAKVIASGDVAECTRCGVVQKLQKCNTAKLDIEVDGAIQSFSPVIYVKVNRVKLPLFHLLRLMLSLMTRTLLFLYKFPIQCLGTHAQPW